MSQRVDELCPSLGKHASESQVCIPIEEVPARDFRARGKDKKKHLPLSGWRPEEMVLYKSSAAKLPIGFKRNVYIDLGANEYSSSIENWFRKTYPGGKHFNVIAFEANENNLKSFKNHPEVELHNVVVWHQNTTIPWKSQGSRSGFVGGGSSDPASGTKKAIDIADFIKRRFVRDDFVVVKMDIEGAEYNVVPRLLETGAVSLIDEIFVEIHTNINTCCRGRRDREYKHARQLLLQLRAAGVYAHIWS
jgi:FkbM family methyltransferase